MLWINKPSVLSLFFGYFIKKLKKKKKKKGENYDQWSIKQNAKWDRVFMFA